MNHNRRTLSKPFKTLLVLLSVVSLWLSQSGAGLATASVPRSKAGCCAEKHCPSPCCVGRNQDQAPETPPATPATASPQVHQSATIPFFTARIDRHESGRNLLPPEPFTVGSFTRVPLYVRSHSYLI
jgi:hypothetical protein